MFHTVIMTTRNALTTVIKKERDSKSKDDLRNISLTPFISKLVENLIYDRLIEHWGHKMDSGQCGGRKGYSVLIYLVKISPDIVLRISVDLLKIWLLIKNPHFCPILVKRDGNESTKTEYHYDNWTIIENSLLLANISASLIFFGTCFH